MKNNKTKLILNSVEVIIKGLLSEGASFYGITINPMDFETKEEAQSEIKNYVISLIKEMSNIEMIEFCYISIEEHKGKGERTGFPHIHMILVKRNLLDIPFENQLLSFFIGYPYYMEDIQIRELKGFLNIKRYFNYVLKEQKYEDHFLQIYSKQLEQSVAYGTLLDVYQNNEINLAYGASANALKGKCHDIKGSPKLEKEMLLIYLWNLFFRLNNYFVFRDQIYVKDAQAKYTYKVMESIELLKIERMNIIKALKEKYPQHFVSFEESMKLAYLKYMTGALKLVYNTNNVLPTKKIIQNFIEFKDGIYNIKTNEFYRYDRYGKEFEKLGEYIACSSFFNVSFRQLNTPHTWLGYIQRNFPNDEDLRRFCASLGALLHKEHLNTQLNKQRSLMIIGPSNSGKTLLVANILSKLIGPQFIGMVKKGGNFNFSNVKNKDLIILDEFEYNAKIRSDLLKLIGGETLLIEEKFKQAEQLKITSPVLLLSNEGINEEMFNDKAFSNRIFLYRFTKLIESMENYQLITDREIPEILVYCNNLYFEVYNKKVLRFTNKKRETKLLNVIQESDVES